MAELFISYAREDKEFVQRLHRALEARDRNVWIDLEGILPSAEWRQEICEAVEAADAIVLIISPHFAASKVCSDELSHAIRNNKRIIPILREDLDESTLPDAVRGRQWLFFTEKDDFEQALEKLITALDTDLDWVRAHTRLLTRAIEWDKKKRNYVFALRGSDLREAEKLLTKHEAQEPRFLPLQIDYILASRKDANRVIKIVLGASAAAMLAVVILGGMLWLKRAESILTEAANFREMGIAELGTNNPAAAEVLLAHALSLSDNQGARERLIEARAKSPELLWISPSIPDNSMLAVSSDGMLFATLTGLTIAIWSVPERQRVRAFRTRITPGSAYATFDNKHRLFAIGSIKEIEVWDVASASELPIRTMKNPYEISSLAFGVDGGSVFAGSENGFIVTWNIQSIVPTSSFQLHAHSDRVMGIATSADGRELVTGSWDHIAKVWGLRSYTEDASFTKHDDALLCVAISPDGEIVASAGWDDTIWIWDRKTGKPIRALVGHKGSVLSLAFSPNGTWLGSGSEDRTVRLWDVEKGKHVLTLPGHADDVKSVAFSDGSNGKYQLVTGDATGVVRLWDIGKIGQREELSTLRGHRGAVTTVSFHPSAPIIASSSVDKSIIIWDIGSTRLLKRLDDQGNDISAVGFSPDGHHVASVNKTGTVKVWNIDSGEFVSFGDGAVDDKMRHVAFSHDGSLLVAGSEEGKIKVWSAKAGELLGSFTAHTAKIQGLDFSPDGTLLASSSEDASVKLWRVADWSLRSTLNGHHSGVYQIAFSPDGRFLVSGSDDKTVRLWNLSGKELLKPILHASPIWAVDFSPDGKMIATGSQDSALQLWDVTVSGDTAKLKNHVVLRITDGPIWWMKFKRVQDKMILGVGSQDKTVRIFSMTAFKTLFSSPQKLESEGEQQGGLMVGEGPTGEREIIPLSSDRFTPKVMENLRAAVHSRL